MQFVVKRDILLKSLNFVQGVVEKKNTLPILSNVLIQLKEEKTTEKNENKKFSKKPFKKKPYFKKKYTKKSATI